MGKIRLKVVGDEALEQKQKEKAKQKKEAKRSAKAPGLGGGQRIVVVGPTEEELEKVETAETPAEEKTKTGKKKFKEAKKKKLSKRYTQNASLVAKNTIYPIGNGIEILKKFKNGNFDETVELHVNVKEKGVAGQMTLPHGTGKKLRIKIADEILISEIEKGKIDFDILVATPEIMPRLAKVAKILGPRGLMPNPKAGTISDKPEAVVEKLSKGQVSFKTEAQNPIIHMSVGKLSFDESKLSENIKAAISAIGAGKIENITLKSTMSPAIKIQV